MQCNVAASAVLIVVVIVQVSSQAYSSMISPLFLRSDGSVRWNRACMYACFNSSAYTVCRVSFRKKWVWAHMVYCLLRAALLRINQQNNS